MNFCTPTAECSVERVPIELQALKVLKQDSYFRGCNLDLKIKSGGVLIVSGRVPTFYVKQMLQTLLKCVDGVRRVDNRTEVVCCDHVGT
jgi:hypothetical protein